MRPPHFDRYTDAWLRLSLGHLALGVESSSVVVLRLAKIMRGGAAGAAEAQLMVTEKLEALPVAATRAAFEVMSGRGIAAALATQTNFRRKVRANRRRLSRAS
ncbi:MAG: hypothetical protein ABW042_06385 [Phenylobacterium sp.]